MPFAVVSAILPSLSAKETLPPLMVVTLPSVSNCALFKPCKSLASLTLSVPLRSSETTPMLLSDKFRRIRTAFNQDLVAEFALEILVCVVAAESQAFCSSVPMLSNAPCTVLTGAACVPSVLVTTRFRYFNRAGSRIDGCAQCGCQRSELADVDGVGIVHTGSECRLLSYRR